MKIGIRGEGGEVCFSQIFNGNKVIFSFLLRFPHSGIIIVDNPFPFTTRLNSMLKNLLTCFLCLLCLISHSQDPEQDSSVQSTLIDSLSVEGLSLSLRGGNKIVLNWKVPTTKSPDYFTIERSCAGKDFETVALLKVGLEGKSFEWVDEAPCRGKNLYRVRITGTNGEIVYSTTSSVFIAGDVSFRFYPNPVDNVLIIRSESLIDIQILDAAGKLRITQPRIQGLQIINVSSLEKGIYLLRITNTAANYISQEKLLKN